MELQIRLKTQDAESLSKLSRHLQDRQFAEFLSQHELQFGSVKEEHSSLFLKLLGKNGSNADKADKAKIIPILRDHIRETLRVEVEVNDAKDSGIGDELLDQAEGGETGDRSAEIPEKLPELTNRKSFVFGTTKAKTKNIQLEDKILQSKNYEDVCEGVEQVHNKLSNSGPGLTSVPTEVVSDLRNLDKSAKNFLEEVEGSGPFGDNPRSALEEVHKSDSSDDDLGNWDLRRKRVGVRNVSRVDTDC